MRSGKDQLEIASALGQQLRNDNWPCSAMVAAWLQAVQGRTAVTWGAWRRFDPDLWDAVNIVDGNQPWSGVIASYMELGDHIAIQNVTPNGEAPQLLDKCWHVVQRWKHVTNDPMSHLGGHAYLVWRDGDEVTVYESDIFDGFRITRGSWEGQAGLVGYNVGVAYLCMVPE